MRVNVLQHTPNEGVGYIGEWAKERGHEVYIYHPYMNDGVLPLAEETDMLVILGGPMNPDDEMPWIQSRAPINFSIDGTKQTNLWCLLWCTTNFESIRLCGVKITSKGSRLG